MRILSTFGLAATVAMVIGSLAPASARVIEHEHFTDSQSHIEQEEHDDFCPNIDFPVLFEGDYRVHLLAKTKGSSAFPYFADRFKGQDVYTNLENGKTFTLQTVGRNSDLRITDNGDGTITIIAKGTGRTWVFANGERLFLDAGQVRNRLVIDYNGTPGNPDDDEFVSFEEISQVGHAGTEGRDFCEDLEFYLS